MNPRESLTDAPITTFVIFILVTAAIPFALYVLFTVWAESIERQIIGAIAVLVLVVFGTVRKKYETLLLALMLFSQFSVSLHSFNLVQPTKIQIFFSDIIIFLTIIVALERRQKLHIDTIGWLFLLLIGWYGVTTCFSSHFHQSLVFLLTQMKYFLVYTLAVNTSLSEQFTRRTIYVGVCVILMQGIIATAQLMHGGWLGIGILGEPSVLTPNVIVGDVTLRVAGTISGANGFAGYISLLLVFIFPFILNRRNMFLDLGFTIGIVSIVMALSRAGWLSFVIGTICVIYMILRARLVKFLRVMIFCLVGFFIIVVGLSLYSNKIISRFTEPQAISAVTDRINQYSQSLEIIKRYKITGIGPGVTEFYGAWNDNIKYVQKALPDIYMWNQVHNGYLQICIESGIPGLIIFLVIAGVIFGALFTTKIDGSEPKLVSLLRVGGLCSAITVLVHISFGPEINNQHILLLFWLLLGLSRSFIHYNQQGRIISIEKHRG